MRTALAVLLSIAGCLPATSPDAVEGGERRARTGNVWADCYRDFQPGDDPSTDLARLGAACAAPAGLAPLGAEHQGAAQSEGAAPERLSFRMRKGRCYRAFAVAAPGVRDLDVAFYDPRGRLAAGDVSRDRWPVVPPRGPYCAEQDGVHTISVAVARGSGDYLLQIWGTSKADAPE